MRLHFVGKFLQLEDITSKFENPCVIDVKIGKITYDPEATAEKRAKETNKYPPLKKTGFQLRGFRVSAVDSRERELWCRIYLTRTYKILPRFQLTAGISGEIMSLTLC